MGFNENQISALGPGREDEWSQHLADSGCRLLSDVHHHKECDVETVLLGSLEWSEGEGGFRQGLRLSDGDRYAASLSQ